MEKFSNYNIEIQDKDDLIIFNSITSAILSLDNKYICYYNDAKISNDFMSLPEELYKNLIKGGMIISSDIDELCFLDSLHRIYRYQNNKLVLTIAPTLDCNFSCPYCYENGRRNGTMSDKTIKKLIEFIDYEMLTKDDLVISWYGGEPLLHIDIINLITEHIFTKGYRYSATMVTNGYLLSKETALQLKKWNINFVQVTLDGPPDIHNKRRYLIDGSPTFSTIIKNITDVCDIITVRIRVNVDHNNSNELRYLFDCLDEYSLSGKVSVYISPVHSINNNCNAQDCMTNYQFSETQIDYYSKYKDRGYFDFSVPQCNTKLCSAATSFSYTVDPNGNFYKCWNDIGNENEIVGNIFSGVLNTQTHTKWLTYSPFSNKCCQNCQLLPICLGGCPDFHMKQSVHNCHYLKNNIPKFIESYKLYKNLP